MDAACTAVHLEEDRRHWYFRWRLAVLRACRRARLAGRRAQLLELGCGSGNVLEALGDLGETVGISPGSRWLVVPRVSLPVGTSGLLIVHR